MRRFAVVGDPIDHSLSPVLHQAVFNSLGLDHTYSKERVEQGNLDSIVKRYDGLSVTMPLKQEAFALGVIRDQASEETGASNTLIMEASGIHAYNTDVLGFRTLMDELDLHTIARAIVIGSGATARSAIVALQDRCKKVEVAARNPDAELPGNPDRLKWGSDLRADLVISTVPAEVDLAFNQSEGHLIDVNYSTWPSPIAARWNGPTHSGLELLVHQAAFQSQLFLAPLNIELDQIRQTMRSALPA